MIRRIVLSLVALLGIAAAACGGGGGGSDATQVAPTSATAEPQATEAGTAAPQATASPEVAAYFRQLGTLADEYRTGGESLTLLELDGYGSDDEARAALTSFLNDGLTVIDAFVGGLDGLEPPAEVATAHDEAVAAGEGVITRFHELIDQAEGATSHEELAVVFTSLMSSAEAFSRFGSSCVALQQIADGYGLDVDLQCG